MTRLGTLLALTVCLGSSVLHGADVRGWEGTVELPTYVLGAPDPNPAFPLINRHNTYPYTMLDDLGDRREVKTYPTGQVPIPSTAIPSSCPPLAFVQIRRLRPARLQYKSYSCAAWQRKNTEMKIPQPRPSSR